ncbi:unnamed protein product [Aphis gossypii]|uniref:Uncharacterized protein n=1 Tax=Aphis gossypii TaxID=80765 RepID=A0A9P0J830_APHGO|nr:unnamed protein product [Aphis gossypii]
MPKTKKKTINDKKRCTSKKTVSKRQHKSVFKFDIKKILEKRWDEGIKLLIQDAESNKEMIVKNDLSQLYKENVNQTINFEDGNTLPHELINLDHVVSDHSNYNIPFNDNSNAESDKEMIVKNDLSQLYQENVNQTINFEDDNTLPLELINLDHVVSDHSNYNIPFDDNSNADSTELCTQRFKIMSLEENEVVAKIHFNHLMKANWSPEFDDVRKILYKWRPDLDTPTSPSLEFQKVKRHNFELVINFIRYNILKNDKKFSVAQLLEIANFIVTIYFDPLFGQMINVIKILFSACIETALEEDNDNTIIAVAQDIYSKYNKDDLLNMTVDLFLPLKGQIMKKMYTYLTYKLFKSLLEKTDDMSSFPSCIKEWFVQDLVAKNYFNKNENNILCSVIQLLEHIVVIFDLYKEEEKLNDMYNFLCTAIKSTGLSDPRFVNILDQWRLRLFRLYVNRQLVLNNDL